MDKVDELYFNLTGVDIEEQQTLWNERGKGYYGEYLVFKELYQNIPGCCKFLMNVEIPTATGKTTEIDLLMLHETGIYVFEIKHYKGTIYGDFEQEKWTQYFRTTPNHSFPSPIFQNNYHVQALKTRYPNAPIRSIVVFTNTECDLRVTGSNECTNVCLLYDLPSLLKRMIVKSTSIFDMEQIDKLFCDLKPFAPILDNPITANGQAIPFYQYVEALTEDFRHKTNTLSKDFQQKANENAIKTKTAIVVSVTICVFLFISSFFVCNHFKEDSARQISEAQSQAIAEINAAQQELDAFKQKFEYVPEFNLDNINVSNLASVTDVVLEDSRDITNAVNFSCTLNYIGDNYGVSIGKNAKIVVILKNGSIQEYDLWNNTYPFRNTYYLGAYNTGKIGVHEFYDINVSDISYIKLINLGVWRSINYQRKDVINNYEIELYRAAE